VAKKIIEVKNLIKKYDGFTAVKGISFDVNEGEIFGLLGPNGAGKTTTLEIMETLRDETEGEVHLNGYSINNHPRQIKRIIGVQLQAAGYYPNLTLSEIVEQFAGLYNLDVEPEEILKQVGLVEK
jgi:ABC-2 type transport system ATP-binding protein